MPNSKPVVEIKELDKFTLWSRPNNGPNAKPAKLCWCIRDGNPRITVYTNDQNDTERYGIIYGGFNPETFVMLLQNWLKVIDGPNGAKMAMDCKYRPRTEDGMAGEITTMTTVFVGKDEDGICWISLVSNDGKRPKIKFESLLSNFHSLTKPDGSSFTKSEGSIGHTRALITILIEIYSRLTAGFREKRAWNGNKTPAPPSLQQAPAPQAATGTSDPAVTELPFDDDLPF